MERWASIKGYEKLYEVSTYGRVRSIARTITYGNNKTLKIKERILKRAKTGYGYFNVSLVKHGVQKTHNVHRLVADTFLTNPNNLPCVNHIDCNKYNNNITNLEFTSYAANALHARQHSLGKTVLDVFKVIKIRTLSNINTTIELATMFGVSKQTIRDVIRNKTWRYV